MTGVVTVICLALAFVTVLVSGVRALRDRAPTRFDLAFTAVIELAVLVYVAVRAIDLAGGHHPDGLGLLIVYLIGIALTMPVTAVLSWVEPSRWGSVVLASGALVVCVLFARINQLWTPHG